jgi:hypothetical protein
MHAAAGELAAVADPEERIVRAEAGDIALLALEFHVRLDAERGQGRLIEGQGHGIIRGGNGDVVEMAHLVLTPWR